MEDGRSRPSFVPPATCRLLGRRDGGDTWFQESDMKSESLIGAGLGIGAGIGAAMGSATHHMGVWLALGTGIGLAIAVGIRDRRNAMCARPKQESEKSTSN
jgi:hypothetical protein